MRATPVTRPLRAFARSRRAATTMAALTAFGFFFNVHLRLDPDGSGKMLVEYPPNLATSFQSESARFGSPTSTVTGFRMHRGLTQVRVRFDDVNKLTETQGLANSVLRLQPEAGGAGRFEAVIRSTAPGDQPVLDNTETSTITVRLPGAARSANGGDIAGSTVRWKEPARDFLSHDGIRLEATYDTKAPVADRASAGTRDSG